MASAALAWLSAQVKLFCAKQLRPAATKPVVFAQWLAPLAEIGFSGNHFAREGNGIRVLSVDGADLLVKYFGAA